jgi:hypothetical protein
MMDHVVRHSKDEDKPARNEPSRNVKESDEKTEGSYYYDDSSNYEVYQDDDDDADDCSVSQ